MEWNGRLSFLSRDITYRYAVEHSVRSSKVLSGTVNCTCISKYQYIIHLKLITELRALEVSISAVSFQDHTSILVLLGCVFAWYVGTRTERSVIVSVTHRKSQPVNQSRPSVSSDI